MFCTCGPEFHLIGHFEYTSKSNTEFQESFISLCMIFWSFVSSKTSGQDSIWWKHVSRNDISKMKLCAIGYFEYTSKFNTEFYESFVSLCMTFWSFVLSDICGRAASGGNMLVESIFSKWDFVQVLLLNAEEQNTFCHKTKKIKASFVLPSFTKKWTHQSVGNSSKWLLGIF